MNRLLPIVSAVAALAPFAGAATLYDDDFADGVRGSQWTAVTDNPGRLSLVEQNGRLDLLGSAGGSASDDALYLSNFRLSTAADFSATLRYSFTGYASAGAPGTNVAVVFGVGRDLEGTDSAAIGQGWATASFGGFNLTASGAVGAYRTDDVQTTALQNVGGQTSGTFLITYTAATDVLTLGEAGTTNAYTLTGVVRGTWQADSLLISLGGRGSGFGLASGNASLDDFAIESGTVLVPEPGCLTGLTLCVLLGQRRRILRCAN